MSDDAAPLETESEETRLEAIRDDFEDEIYANDVRDLITPVIALILYALPACGAVVGLYAVESFTVRWLFSASSAVSVVGAWGIYYSTSGNPGDDDEPLEEVYPDDQEAFEWPWTFPPSRELTDRDDFDGLDGEEIEILLTEYEQIAEEVRYRDGLLNRTTYFGVAILGILGTALDAVSISIKPLIILVISITMYVFAMALVKYKDARDLHWKRQRDLERLIPEFREKLTVFHTNRTARRRFLDRFSLTSFMVNLFVTLFLVSSGAYLVVLILLPWFG